MKVSVIIPNYNASKYIINCIESVLKQTYKDIEIIIVDDGSTDNSVKIINDYKNKYSNIIFIQQFNQNASVARNRAIEIATGEYLYFLDSDDEICAENTIKLLVDNIKDVDLVIGNYEIVDENNNIIKIYKNKSEYYGFDNKYRYCGISPVPSNKLYSTKLVKENNIYFANVRIGQDLNFYLKYLLICTKIKILDLNIYKHRIVQNGMSNSVNLNFMDIYNTINDVKKFSNKKLNYDYAKYVTIVAVKHYRLQLSKNSKIKNRKAKIAIYKNFNYFISENKKDVIKTAEYKNEYKKYVLTKILLKVNLYKRFVKLYHRNEKIHNREIK